MEERQSTEDMARSKAKYFDIKQVIQMAKDYGVSENPLFVQTLKNYETVQKAIEMTNAILDSEDMTISKEYVKGRENLYMHPAIKELPKQIDAANKTVDKLLDIIERLGKKNTTGDELLDYIRK
ncbi:MAG: hypothetical protein IKN95_05310 [Lachnospiraceae bacterium]|nr:hypothetical protein [Lachnospiraceae bacterium]